MVEHKNDKYMSGSDIYLDVIIFVYFVYFFVNKKEKQSWTNDHIDLLSICRWGGARSGSHVSSSPLHCGRRGNGLLALPASISTIVFIGGGLRNVFSKMPDTLGCSGDIN